MQIQKTHEAKYSLHKAIPMVEETLFLPISYSIIFFLYSITHQLKQALFGHQMKMDRVREGLLKFRFIFENSKFAKSTSANSVLKPSCLMYALLSATDWGPRATHSETCAARSMGLHPPIQCLRSHILSVHFSGLSPLESLCAITYSDVLLAYTGIVLV